ncbi:MAG: type II toxin-antitoxin system VapC family toxin [Thiolinea sp.]
MFVLDYSVTMTWCFADEQAGNHYAAQVLERMKTDAALVPRLWHLEVLNVLLVAERSRRINR